MRKIILGHLALFALLPSISRAQGCSDAGVCTAGHITSGILQNDPILKLGTIFGVGENDVSYFDLEANYSHPLNATNSLQIKLPYRFISGDIGNVSGLSDLTLSWARAWRHEKEWQVSTVFGVKIPTNDGNKDALPMAYQTSLGTFDLLAGVSIRNRSFLGSVAFQLPLTQNNNQYEPNPFEVQPIYESTRNFERAPDLVVRLGQVFDNPNNKWHFNYSLLTIIHTQDDSYDAFFPTGDVRLPIANSQGFTANITGGISYAVNEKDRVEFEFGRPIAITTSRPDGLIRLFVGGLRWSRRF